MVFFFIVFKSNKIELVTELSRLARLSSSLCVPLFSPGGRYEGRIMKLANYGLLHYIFSQFLHHKKTKITLVINQTWLALFFECFVNKWKVHHNWTSRIVRVYEHVILLIIVFKGLQGSFNGREFEVVLPCPFLCQQKFLEITTKKINIHINTDPTARVRFN